MKKLALMALSLFCCATLVSAQTYIGARVGANYSTIRGYEDFTPEAKTLPNAGVGVLIKGKGNWTYGGDVLFSQRGLIYTEVIEDSAKTLRESKKYDETLNYLEIPVQFNYNFGSDSSAFRPRVSFGPTLNVRFNSTQQLTYQKTLLRADAQQADSVLNPIVADYDLNSKYSPIDYGLFAGAGISYKINDKMVASADLRLHWGLMDIREQLSSSSSRKANLNYNVFLGFYYLLGK